MRILITGAGGFIGRNLVAHLSQTYPKATIVTVGLEKTTLPGFRVCDLSDRKATQSLIQETRPTHLYHLAGISKVNEALGMPLYFTQNFLTTINLIDELVRIGEPVKFFFASTVHVYGNQTELATESLHPRPESTYAFTKFLSERMLESYTQNHPNLRVVVGRLYSCFGPGQPEGFVTADFCRRIKDLPETQGEPPVMKVGPLKPFRRFLDVRDVVKIFPNLLDAPLPSQFEVFNIASPHERSIGELLQSLLRLSGKNPKVESSEPTGNTFAGLRISVDKLNQTLPDTHFRSVEETLKDMLAE